MIVVTLYGRDQCHLCAEARTMLAALAEEIGPFELREVDIEADDALLSEYLERIPVVEVGGEIVSELVPDREGIRRALITDGPPGVHTVGP